MSKFRMRIDLNVLNHLGLNLYSNVPSVLSEVVANSWDADANRVEINIKRENEKPYIDIKDTGHGMDLNDINEKYLTIGYARREKGENKTPKFERPVMGRKGIGKLSLFSIANIIEVYSIKGNEKNALRMNANEIRKKISENDNLEYSPEEITDANFDFRQGTKIILRDLKKRVYTGPTMKKRLARRFSILGEKHDFEVFVNGEKITVEDRDYFHKIQYLWYYGDESEEYKNLATRKEKDEKRQNTIRVTMIDKEEEFKLTGWLGLTHSSGSLQDGDDNLNKIVLLVRGKMADEDMLEDFREGGLYTKYLFGEIKADFLDIDDEPDIATSSRQSIIEDDERYRELKKFLYGELKHIQSKRAEYKSESAERDASEYPAIKEWYEGLGRDTKSKAKRLFAKINQVATDEKHQRQLFVYGVLAFESLRYKDAMDSLEKVSLDNIEEFLRIFHEFDDIEASLYYQITRERLNIIKKLKEKVHDENALERILQEYLYKHLWLLDPSWDRATENPYMEQRVSTEFGKINARLTEEEQQGRVDLKYKKTSGKHIIIELKRASVKTSSYDLQKQVDKYRTGLRKILMETTPAEANAIEAICVVGKPLADWDTPSEREETVRSMAQKNTRVVTYQQLINDAYNSYSEYIEKNKERGRILQLIRKIEQESEAPLSD